MVPYYWDRVRPFIERSLTRGSNTTLDEIFNGLCETTKQLWIADDGQTIHAALVTSIERDQESKFLLMLALSGGHLDWRNLLSLFEDWGRDRGCEEVRIYGRKGWARVLGYTAISLDNTYLLRKAL